MIKNSLLSLSLLALSPRQFLPPVHAGTWNDAMEIFYHFEKVALEFRDEIERVFAQRCEEDTLNTCGGKNYNERSSKFPRPECFNKDNFYLISSECECGLMWDPTISKVTFPRTLLPINVDPEQLVTVYNDPSMPEVSGIIETICYTALGEKFMVEKYGEIELYVNVNNTGGKPASLYFSAYNGVFRQVPAKHQNETKSWDFDPRLRPWFVGGSSGPKDVVILLDTSQGMAPTRDSGARFKAAKDAASTVIETLTVSDRIAVVTFSDTAAALTFNGNEEEELIVASIENQNQLKNIINSTEADGVSNFTLAFDKTFEVLSRSLGNAEHSGQGCSIALIFLTDGAITDTSDDDEKLTDEVAALIKNRIAELEDKFGKKITIFAYSIGGESESNDKEVMKEIACATDGLWTHIDAEKDVDMISVMEDYYQLFASGLGAGENNEDFVAWVEPYKFASDGKLGTTVSVPVYDRAETPYKFLGVVGIDIYMDAIMTLTDLTETEVVNKMITDKIQKDWADKCPVIELESCSSRGGAIYEGLSHMTCPSQSYYSSQSLWNNNDYKEENYTTIACCDACKKDGKNLPDLPDDDHLDPPKPVILGVCIAVPVLVAAAAIGTYIYYRKKNGDTAKFRKQIDDLKNSIIVNSSR